MSNVIRIHPLVVAFRGIFKSLVTEITEDKRPHEDILFDARKLYETFTSNVEDIHASDLRMDDDLVLLDLATYNGDEVIYRGDVTEEDFEDAVTANASAPEAEDDIVYATQGVTDVVEVEEEGLSSQEGLAQVAFLHNTIKVLHGIAADDMINDE